MKRPSNETQPHPTAPAVGSRPSFQTLPPSAEQATDASIKSASVWAQDLVNAFRSNDRAFIGHLIGHRRIVVLHGLRYRALDGDVAQELVVSTVDTAEELLALPPVPADHKTLGETFAAIPTVSSFQVIASPVPSPSTRHWLSDCGSMGEITKTEHHGAFVGPPPDLVADGVREMPSSTRNVLRAVRSEATVAVSVFFVNMYQVTFFLRRQGIGPGNLVAIDASPATCG